jgi:very-short-patch-repair endonuclease
MLETEEKIIELLRHHPGGLRKEAISRLIRGLSLSGIVNALDDLRKHSIVDLCPGSKWRLLNPELPRSIEEIQPLSQPSRWRSFRDLCWYYAQCVRLEERPHLVTDLDKQGSEFIEITRPIDWQQVAAGCKLRLPMDEATRDFMRVLKRGRRGNRLFLGAPVDVKCIRLKGNTERRRIISPVFVIQVEYKAKPDELILEPELMVDVNHGWLERSMRRHSQELQQEFLESVGLREDDQGQAADESGAQAKSPKVTNLAVLHRSLLSSHKGRWREGGPPERPCIDPPIDQVTDDGIYNRVILMAEPRMKFTRSLFAELKYLAKETTDEDIERSAIPLLFSPDEPCPSPVLTRKEAEGTEGEAKAEAVVAEFQLLNYEQRRAVIRALTAPLTVVTGPPGTGKSVVVCHVMANMAMAERPVLFASRNHQALEAVEPRLNALVEPDVLVIRPTRPFGATAGDQVSWIQLMTEILSRPQKPGATEAFRKTFQSLGDIVVSLRALEEAILNQFQLGNDLTELNETIQRALVTLNRSVEARVRCLPRLARPDVYRGLAVALDPTSSSAGFLRRLWRRTGGILSRRVWISKARRLNAAAEKAIGEPRVLGPLRPRASPKELAEQLRLWTNLATAVELAGQCLHVESRIQACRDLNELKDVLIRTQAQLQSLTRRCLAEFVDKAGGTLSPAECERFASIRGALKLTADTVNPDRQTRELTVALRESFSSIIRHYPAWAVSNLSARSALPFSAGVFDLLVIDEASQCDIASVVPLIFRARRLMVVGDPMQLPPVFKLRPEADRQIRSRLHLDDDVRWGRYLQSANSFYDLASSTSRLDHRSDLILLSGHYRCHSAIADYCNSSFYRKTLRVRTNQAGLNAPSRGESALEGCIWSHVPGDAVGGSQGSYSPAQIEAIIGELKRLEEEKFRGTLGVVTPFRVQANRISDRAAEQLDRDLLERWDFHVDTADGFQGDERDVILFSLVGSYDMPEGSLWFYRSNKNRFNVAASRAKALLHIFGDKDWARTCGISYIQALLESCERPRNTRRRDDLIGPVWEPLLAEALRAGGLSFEQQHPACGYYLDFALYANGVRLDVEVDGETYHRDEITGQLQVEDVYRDWLLSVAGWKVQRFWVYQLRENMEACVERIRKQLEHE